MVVVLEAVKALVKIREYSSLISRENIKVLLDYESYKMVKETKDFEESICQMIRSQKTFQRPET